MPSVNNQIFKQALLDYGLKIHNFAVDEYRLILLNSDIVLTFDLADPTYGNLGSTDLSIYEVSAGGSYPLGGVELSTSWLFVGDSPEFTSSNVNFPISPNNPVNARYAVIYNNDSLSKKITHFIDLGEDVNMVTNPLNIILGTIYDFKAETLQG